MQSVVSQGQPVIPSKIVCVGRNYVAHIKELGNEVPDEMVIFLKPNSSIGATLHSEHQDEALHYEAEIALLVGDAGYAAVGVGLDLTRRQLQSKLKADGLPWERAKAFNSAALFSEFVALPESIDTLRVRLKINGEVRQDGGVELMMYQPAEILEQLSSFLTLEPGDIVMTGTPAGVGEVRRGDKFHGAILDGDSQLVSAQWLAD